MITSLDVDAEEEFNKLLEQYTFAELLERGDVLNTQVAARMLGYSPFRLRQLCQAGKMGHIRRGVQYFFLRSQVDAARPRVVPPKDPGGSP